jgi:DNA-binding NtrC family response regulator
MQNGPPHLLLVDDDPLIVDTLSIVLGQAFQIHSAASREAAVNLVRSLPVAPQLALIDLGLPPVPHEPDEGYRLISALLSHSPAMKIIVLSGQSEVAAARHARSLGATEFVAKPAKPAHLKQVLLEALQASAAELEAAEAAAPVTSQASPLDNLIGTSEPMAGLKTQVGLYADSPFPVLIEGESGSGKEVVAACLHALGPRRAKPYLALNCAAIAPSLVEPTLFGYAKGAFTGTQTSKAGYFEDAQDGTLFLDEIGELPLALQAKLLRVLENGEYNRVGETTSRKSQARILAATNRDLRNEAKQGAFRADLYHRLSVFSIRVPPLRDLGEDKLLLLTHFRALYTAAAGARPFTLSEPAGRLWLDYPFPGNVRELRNVVIRLVTKFPDRAIDARELESELDSGAVLMAGRQMEGDSIDEAAQKELSRRGGTFNLDDKLEAWERAYISSAMKLANGNVSQAARLLGINRTTLYSRMAALERSVLP